MELFLYGDVSELREKLRCQELQNIWSECLALNTPKGAHSATEICQVQ